MILDNISSPHLKHGETAFMMAAKGGHLKILYKLIDSGADVDKANKVSVLSLAYYQGRIEPPKAARGHATRIDSEMLNVTKHRI